MGKSSEVEAYRRWQKHCENVQQQTTVNTSESPADRQARVERARSDYAFFVDYYFPHYTTNPTTGQHTACAPFHIDAAKRVKKTRNLKAVFKWARGHAKSTHFDVMIPLWLKCQKVRELNVMVLVGKSQDNANTLLGDVQAELEFNQRYVNDFGVQKNEGSWQDGEFVTADGCAFFARGRGQSPRGLRYRSNRPDYIVIDDLDDDELVNNPDRVSRLTNWVKEALFGALDGGRGRFIMVGNLIGKNSVLANIAATSGVHVSQVNVWGRDGKPSWAAKWTADEVNAMAQFMGYRSFQKEMMNNPITEGAVFKSEWIRWKKPLPLDKYDELVAYCDPSFKSTAKNDFKAIKLWGKAGSELHNLAAFVRQTTVAEMVRWFYDLHERLHPNYAAAPSFSHTDKRFVDSYTQLVEESLRNNAITDTHRIYSYAQQQRNAVCSYYIEANFLQDIILDEFTREGNLRGYQLPIRADRRKKPDKFQRVEGISPLWERGFVYYNEKLKSDPDMQAGIEQTLAFEKGMSGHDDAPDADEGAIYILQQRTRVQTFAPRIGERSASKSKHSW